MPPPRSAQSRVPPPGDAARLRATFQVLLTWLDFLLARLGTLGRQVRVRRQRRTQGQLTYVEMDYRLAAPSGLGLLITTERRYLSTHEFDPDLAARFNRRPEERGRTVYCEDRENDQLMAAIMYHVDPRTNVPILVTAIALRHDGDPEFQRLSRACALTTKAAVHAIGGALGRGATVGYDARTAAEVAFARPELGFRPARPPSGLTPNGIYLEQEPFTPDGLPRWVRQQLRALARP